MDLFILLDFTFSIHTGHFWLFLFVCFGVLGGFDFSFFFFYLFFLFLVMPLGLLDVSSLNPGPGSESAKS